MQVHWYDDSTAVLRQSKRTHYEAPYLVLLLGHRRALLLDTGATADPAVFPLRTTVDGLVDTWLGHHPEVDPTAYELVVAHTHAHGDHVAGDAQLADRPATTVVGTDLEAVVEFFGFVDWPERPVRFDLGGREVEVIGSPGHHETSISVYDPHSGLLLTGDTVYPGRLYVVDREAFAATLDRLVAICDIRDVSWVLGCHVEMTTTPGRDYPLGATFQPHEPPPQLTVDQLHRIRDEVARVKHRRGVHRLGDVILYNEAPKADWARLMLRGKMRGLLERVLV